MTGRDWQMFLRGMLFMAVIASITMCVTLAFASNIPAEPGQDYVLHRYMKPQQRAFIIVYDLDNDGTGDYMTQRNIGQNFSAIAKYPVYYGVDFNGDGTLDKASEVFIDPQQDGLNGNEILLAEWEEAQKTVEG